MSTQNQISIVIPQQVIDSVTLKMQECKQLLEPYLQALKATDKASIFKMGDLSVATVKKVKAYMDTNPEFVPNYMDKTEFLKDEAVVTLLNPIGNLANQLASDIEDTVTLAGGEAMQASLLYYGQVKEAHHRGIASAKPIYEDLSQRFSKKGTKSTTPKP